MLEITPQVISITGTASQITVSAPNGAVTLSLPATINVNTSGNASTVTTNANLTGPITSVGNATSIASQTGTGTKFVVDTAPVLQTNITVHTATNNNMFIRDAFSLPNGVVFQSINDARDTDRGFEIRASTLAFMPSINMKLNGTAARATTEGTGHLDIFDGTAPVGTLANGISLYSTAGELRVMDSGGTATLLSSHSRKTGEWIHDSYNVISHKRLIVQAEKMAKFIDEKFGTHFVEELYD